MGALEVAPDARNRPEPLPTLHETSQSTSNRDPAPQERKPRAARASVGNTSCKVGLNSSNFCIPFKVTASDATDIHCRRARERGAMQRAEMRFAG